MSYAVLVTSTARRALESGALPAHAAAACWEMITGPIAAAPYRAGKALRPPFTGLHSARRGDYRIIYRVDDDKHQVIITDIRHRSAAYRPR